MSEQSDPTREGTHPQANLLLPAAPMYQYAARFHPYAGSPWQGGPAGAPLRPRGPYSHPGHCCAGLENLYNIGHKSDCAKHITEIIFGNHLQFQDDRKPDG